MAAPTVRLTKSADAALKQLGIESDAVLAMRVRQVDGPLTGEKWRFWLTNLLSWLPLVGIAAERALNSLFGDQGSANAVLVLTADEGRYLLAVGGWGGNRPGELLHTFSHGAPLMPDEELEASVFAHVMIDGRRHIVNTVDFRYLVKMIFTGQVSAPELRDVLKDHWRAVQWVEKEDPNQVVDAFHGTFGPKR